MTREEKIEAVVESMASWDAEELLEWAQNTRRGFLLDASDAEVDEDFQSACVDEDEDRATAARRAQLSEDKS